MKNIYLLAALCAFFCLQSCQIDAVTHFNKDYSGHSSTTIDLSQMMSFASSFDQGNSSEDPNAAFDSLFMMLDGSIENDSSAIFLDSLKTAFEEAGMKNFSFGREGDYGLSMNFEFDDLSVFDGQSMQNQLREAFGENDDFDNEMFQSMSLQSTTVKRDGKWLIIDLFGGMDYDEFRAQLETELEGNTEEKSAEQQSAEQNMDMAFGMMEMMGGMYEFNNTYSFDRKIKEISSSLPYTSDKKTVTLSYTMADLFEILKKEEKAELRIRLKHCLF